MALTKLTLPLLQTNEQKMPHLPNQGGDNFQMIPDQTINYKNTGFLDNDLLVTYLNKKNPLQLPKSKRIVIKGNNNVPKYNPPSSSSSSAWSWVRIPNSALNNTIFMLWMFTVCSFPLIYKDI